jgi:hypothetical protein
MGKITETYSNLCAHLDSGQCEEKVPMFAVLCHILVVASHADRCSRNNIIPLLKLRYLINQSPETSVCHAFSTIADTDPDFWLNANPDTGLITARKNQRLQQQSTFFPVDG